MMIVRQPPHDRQGQKSQNREKSSLYQQKPPMPSMRLEILGLYPAEGQEEHRKDQQRLEEGYRSGEERSGRMQRRYRMV